MKSEKHECAEYDRSCSRCRVNMMLRAMRGDKERGTWSEDLMESAGVERCDVVRPRWGR